MGLRLRGGPALRGSPKKLRTAVRLMLLHPQFAFRSCRDCQRYSYDRDENVKRDRNGRPYPRPAIVPTPCQTCPKLRGERRKAALFAVEVTDRDVRALNHYLECRAVSDFPADPIVRSNAAIIRAIMDEIERAPLQGLIDCLTRGTDGGNGSEKR